MTGSGQSAPLPRSRFSSPFREASWQPAASPGSESCRATGAAGS